MEKIKELKEMEDSMLKALIFGIRITLDLLIPKQEDLSPDSKYNILEKQKIADNFYLGLSKMINGVAELAREED